MHGFNYKLPDFHVTAVPENYSNNEGSLIRESGTFQLDVFQSSTIKFETKFLPPNLANKLF